MKPNEDQRQELARLIEERLHARYQGTKNAFYGMAGVNPGTFDRALEGKELRPASLAGIIRAGWPETGGDWQVLLAGVTQEPTRSVGGEGQDPDYVAAPGERSMVTIAEEDLELIIREAVERARRLDRS